jgi:beta-glucosidase
MNRKTLLPAVQSGKLSEAIIDDKVRRILRTTSRFGWLDHNQASLEIPLDNQDGSRAALRASEEGIVLLKNDPGCYRCRKRSSPLP